MAKITATSDTAVLQIKEWKGLNECPDGDAGMQMGEAAEMTNWCVTSDGHLQVRPGTRTLHTWNGENPVRGLWNGLVGGEGFVVCAIGGMVYKCHDWDFDATLSLDGFTSLGAVTDAETHFFGFDDKLYIMTGSDYKVWDGATFGDVAGYRPIVSITVPPSGGGTAYERVNMLNGLRRCWFSPDGTSTVFHLPGGDINTIDYCKNVATGQAITYTGDATAGTLTFEEAPAEGTNSIEVGWTVNTTQRSAVTSMRYSELYNGTTDNRVFLYGDGTNRAIYSGLTNDGKPTAEYFPDMNFLDAGESNTPITGMIRHFSRLLVFKLSSTYCIQYGTITLEDSSITAGFFLSPVNRAIGNEAMGSVCLVQNNPRTLCAGAVYEWKSAGGYLTIDERNAKRISNRVANTLSTFDLSAAHVFDDNSQQQFYILYNGKAVVHNYERDAWYIYDNFPVTHMIWQNGKLFGGTSTGKIVRISKEHRSDDGEAINAFWRSGSMDFGREWIRKYSTLVFVNIKPESGARVQITARSDRSAEYPVKVVASSFASFSRVDFNHFSFNTNRRPQVRRIKLKVKKIALYQLIIESNSAAGTATVLSVDIQTRYTGNVK